MFIGEQAYLNHMQSILDYGELKTNRTGIDTLSLFGHQMKFDLRDGTFPLLTTKKVFMKGVIHELLWFLNGDTNIEYLVDNDVHIWDAWADEAGELGPVYGAQWRSWQRSNPTDNIVLGPIDQMKQVIKTLRSDPDSRRIIVSAWNVAEIEEMALPPCHLMFQFNASAPDADGKRYLDLQLYQRSADWFLGVPFNIASYALLLMMVAQQVGMRPRHFVHTFGDTHLYVNHTEQADLQLSRDILRPPTMRMEIAEDLFSYTYDDFVLADYNPHPAIKAEVAV